MCIACTPAETLDIVLDALPTALSCDLVYLALPGPPVEERAMLCGAQVPESELPALAAALGQSARDDGAHIVASCGELWCLEAEVPLEGEPGRLVAGRRAPLDPSTDRVLVRSAANLVGCALENARVLDLARRKDEFLAVLGHELRNPLAPVATAVELLARHPVALREQQVIERHLRHLSRLVDDLLDISRVTRGHVELRSEDVTLTSILERAVEITAPVVARHRHALRVASAEGIAVRGDPVRLAQIFSNLLANAAKFTRDVEAPRVTLGMREDDNGRCVFHVADNGAGFDPQRAATLFQPFVRLHSGEKFPGTGVGLSIVRRIVERHGGWVRASATPGAGARFDFTLAAPSVLDDGESTDDEAAPVP